MPIGNVIFLFYFGTVGLWPKKNKHEHLKFNLMGEKKWILANLSLETQINIGRVGMGHILEVSAFIIFPHSTTIY